jgi:hypothetical protein
MSFMRLATLLHILSINPLLLMVGLGRIVCENAVINLNVAIVSILGDCVKHTVIGALTVVRLIIFPLICTLKSKEGNGGFVAIVFLVSNMSAKQFNLTNSVGVVTLW